MLMPTIIYRPSLPVQLRTIAQETHDLYSRYQQWRRNNHLRSFPSKPFSRIAKEEIEITWGLKLRHDLPGDNGKPRRGWRGLALVEGASVQNPKNKSAPSGL
jgi:hypothetical protein